MRSVRSTRRLLYPMLALLALASVTPLVSDRSIAAPATRGAKATTTTTEAKSTASKAATATQASASAALSLTDSLRLDPTVRTGVLPNGIRWYVKQNHKPED